MAKQLCLPDTAILVTRFMTPDGAPVAAPTTGLPEQAGGGRNWDYRYTWIRDGSFSVSALLGLGYLEEAATFGRWMRDRAADQARDGSAPLKIMYRVDGGSDLAEQALDHFEGWRGRATCSSDHRGASLVSLGSSPFIAAAFAAPYSFVAPPTK